MAVALLFCYDILLLFSSRQEDYVGRGGPCWSYVAWSFNRPSTWSPGLLERFKDAKPVAYYLPCHACSSVRIRRLYCLCSFVRTNRSFGSNLADIVKNAKERDILPKILKNAKSFSWISQNLHDIRLSRLCLPLAFLHTFHTSQQSCHCYFSLFSRTQRNRGLDNNISNGKSSIVDEWILRLIFVPSIVEEQILRFVFVPSIVEEQILRFVFVPSIVGEQILRFVFVPSIVEEQVLWFVFVPLIVWEQINSLFFVPLIVEVRIYSFRSQKNCLCLFFLL